MLTIKSILQVLKNIHTFRHDEYQRSLGSVLPPGAPMFFQMPEMTAIGQLQGLLFEHVRDLQECRGPNARLLTQLDRFEKALTKKAYLENDAPLIPAAHRDYVGLIKKLAPAQYTIERVPEIVKMLEILPISTDISMTQKVTNSTGLVKVTDSSGWLVSAPYVVWGSTRFTELNQFLGDVEVHFSNDEWVELKVTKPGNDLKWEFTHHQSGGSVVKTNSSPTRFFARWSPNVEIVHDALEDESYPGLPHHLDVSKYIEALKALAQKNGFDSSKYRMSKTAFTQALKELRQASPLSEDFVRPMCPNFSPYGNNDYVEFWEPSEGEGTAVLNWKIKHNYVLDDSGSTITINGVGENITSIFLGKDQVNFTDDSIEFELAIQENKNVGPNPYYVLLTEYFYFSLYQHLKTIRTHYMETAREILSKSKERE